MFKNAPNGTVMHNIYEKKIISDPHIEYINTVGYKASVSAIIENNYIIFDNEAPYLRMKEYPCSITKVNSLQ